MKTENFMKRLENLSKGNFICRCLISADIEDRQVISGIVVNNKTYESAISEIIQMSTLEKLTSPCGRKFWFELLKTTDRAWYYVRNNFGEKCRKTDSDAGSLKVGNESFTINIPNGYGDGATRYAVFENRAEFGCSDIMLFKTTISGKFNIYSYDCGNEIENTLDGYYAIYVYDGLIAFVNWN